jgi:hypothetical protein
MRRLTGVWGSVLLLAALAVPGAQTPSAEEVARQVDARDTGRDSRLEMTMRLFDRQGRVRERTLVVQAMRGTGGKDREGDRMLVRFQSPADIRGTGFLVWEHPDVDDERFLYLPALGRVRRIAGAETQESFVGSDLTYEDIGGRELDRYAYTLVTGPPTWTGPDGQAHPVWRLESRARAADAAYPRVVSVVRQDLLMVVAAEIFNRRDEREKSYEVRALRQFDGIWTATDVSMVNHLQRTRTELTVTGARYNLGLTSAAFTRRALETP